MSIFQYLCVVVLLGAGMATSLAAPRVPQSLKENGLLYCSHSVGFSFNPQASVGTDMNIVSEQIYEKLFEVDSSSPHRFVPKLAKSYRMSQNGKTLHIVLRKGVWFHQTSSFTPTRPFNANDVVFSFQRILSDASWAGESTEHKWYAPYFDRLDLKNKIASVSVVSDYEVDITLFRPDYALLSYLASPYIVMYSQEYAQYLEQQNQAILFDSQPVGTGPYQLEDYVRGQYVRLQANSHYWGKLARIPHVVVDFTTHNIGRFAKFLNQECDMATFPEISQLALIQEQTKQERFHIVATEGMNVSFLAFNMQKATLQDPNIRQALAQSINRERIVKNIYHYGADIAEGLIPTLSWAYRTLPVTQQIHYAPQQARTVLQDKKLNLTLWVLNEPQMFNPNPAKMATLIQDDLEQVGVKVDIHIVNRNDLLEQQQIKEQDYDLILSGWLTTSLEPDTFLRPILSCQNQNNVSNMSNWCSWKFDHLLNNALQKSTQAARTIDYQQAQALVLSHLPLFPIAHVKRLFVVNDRVQGLRLSPFGHLHFATLSYKKSHKKEP